MSATLTAETARAMGLRATPALLERLIFDLSDLDLLTSYSWSVTPKGYARGWGWSDGAGVNVRMHRLICPAPGLEVDHINGNKLDNRRCNLRAVTSAQNSWNAKLSKRNTSGHKGVSYCNVRGLWHAYLMVYGRRIHLGFHKCIDQAIAARTACELAHFGEYARK